MRILLSYPGSEFDLPEKNLIDIIEPKVTKKDGDEIIRKALAYPIGSVKLSQNIHEDSRILIIVDDHTRNTPADKILKILLEELIIYVKDKSKIQFLIASGTHRPMTREEKIKKLGKDVVDQYIVHDHDAYNMNALVTVGNTSTGIPIQVNRLLLDFNFIIGLGHIVPHRNVGFSGGAKIIQPGVCGAETTGRLHWDSIFVPNKEMLGNPENVFRKLVEEIGRRIGLNFIVNVVMDANGNIAGCVAGDPVEAHRVGCSYSKEINGFKVKEKADVVICDSYPADIDFWQACKALFCADLAVKPGGICILRTPCPEGISGIHSGINEFGYMPLREVEILVQSGKIKDLAMAANLAAVGEVLDTMDCRLVSEGISREEAYKVGLGWNSTIQEGIDGILTRNPGVRFLVINHTPELLPLL